MKRVECIWEDVFTKAGWHDPDEKFASVLCTQVGYVRSQDEKYLILVSSFTSDGDIGDVTKIPISLVRKIRRI